MRAKIALLWIAGTVVAGAGAGCAQLGQYATVTPQDRAAVQDACEAKARSDHMTITNWHGIRQASPDVFQADVTVEYKNAPYERTCTYKARDRAVDFSDAPGQGPFSGVGNQLDVRQRARDACEAKAKDDNMQIVSWMPFQQLGDDRYEANVRVQWKGQTYDRTCVYKDKSQNVEIK